MALPIDYFWSSLTSILIGHLNHSNQIRNEKVMAKIRKLVITGCTGTPLMCTGTHWPKMTRTQSIPVHVQSVPVHITLNYPECVFFIHFSILFHPNQLYTSNTHQNHFNFTLESLFYSIHLSISYLSSRIHHGFLPKPF